MAEWFDVDLLHAVAALRPALNFAVVGPLRPALAGSAATAPANVHYFGARPYAELPAWLQHADAALIPFKCTLLTAGVDPVKLYEYLAAELPVVATPFSVELEVAASQGALLLAADPAAFAAALDAALAAPAGGRPPPGPGRSAQLGAGSRPPGGSPGRALMPGFVGQGAASLPRIVPRRCQISRHADGGPMKAIAMDEQDWRQLAAAPGNAEDLARHFPTLVHETRDGLYATLRRIVRSDEDAEDLLQDTYLRALSHLRSFRGEGSPEAWLRRIAVRLALNHLRSRRLRRMLPWPLPRVDGGEAVETEAGAERRPGPEALASEEQRRRRLEALLAAHPAKAQAAFALRHLEDRPYAEIAALIGASEATTRSLVSRTVSRLEREIHERGWSDD